MRIAPLVLLVVVLVLASPTSRAQQTSDLRAQSDPQAVQLLTKAFSLMGGAQGKGVVDIRLEGTMASLSSPEIVIGTFVAKARGEDWSLETTHQTNRTIFRVLNGRGSTTRDGSTKSLHPSITSGLQLDLLPLFGRWTDFKEPGSVASLVGESTIDGANCYQVHVRSGRGSPDPSRANHHGELDVFVDSSSGLVSAIRYKAAAGMPAPREVVIENRFAHYEHFGALLIPTEIKRFVASVPIGIFHISALLANNGFSDADFQN